MNLLEERRLKYRQSCERQRLQLLGKLRTELQLLLSGQRVFVYGSAAKPHCFGSDSDIDVAIELEPPELPDYRLVGILSEKLGRPVDICVLERSRLKEKIAREGIEWTLWS